MTIGSKTQYSLFVETDPSTHNWIVTLNTCDRKAAFSAYFKAEKEYPDCRIVLMQALMINDRSAYSDKSTELTDP